MRKSPGLAYPEVFYLSETEEFVIMSKEQHTAFPPWSCAQTLLGVSSGGQEQGMVLAGVSQHWHCLSHQPPAHSLGNMDQPFLNHHATGGAFSAEQKSTFKSQNICSCKGPTRIKSTTLALLAHALTR